MPDVDARNASPIMPNPPQVDQDGARVLPEFGKPSIPAGVHCFARRDLEILTVDEVAALLRISERHVYEMSRKRTRSGDIRQDLIPCLRLGSSVRFRKSDVEAWIERLAARGK